MAAPEPEIIEVRVLGARAEREAIAFIPGVAAQPFSVGTSGQWSVVGNGVGPIHLFLGFDGQAVHAVAASPSLPVLVAGAPLGGSWMRTPLPCEIRFGGACLLIRRAPRMAVSAGAEGAPNTVSDGGALYKAAQRAAHAASGPHVAPEQANLGATRWMEQRPTGLADVLQPPPVLVAVRSDPPAERAPAEKAPSPDEPKKGVWQSASTVKKITFVLLPFALAFGGYVLMDDGRPAPKVPGAASAKARAPLENGAPPSLKVGAGGPGPGPLNAGAPAVASAAPSPMDVAPLGRPVAPPTSRPNAGSGPAKPGRWTPERQALELVANGSFDEAARNYEALFATHPDDLTFKEAARVLRAKAGHVH